MRWPPPTALASLPRRLQRSGLGGFRRLQTKLTVLYSAMFCLVLALVGGSVYAVIARNAEQTIRQELTANGAVFDRMWALKAEQLQDSAGLLARDFGFRAAAATGDKATVESALDNLKGRLAVDRAFFLGDDGAVLGRDRRVLDDGDAGRLGDALTGEDEPSGVAAIGGTPYYVIASPVLAPVRVGWVVFAARLDRRELAALERLSAIPLKATLLRQGSDGRWAVAGAGSTPGERSAMTRFMAEATARQGRPDAPRTLDGPAGRSIAVIKPVKTLPGSPAAVLVLQYPLAAALAPYQPLLTAVGALGLLSLLLLSAGSWALARTLTRPIAALDAAVNRLQHGGETVEVAVESADEIGRLAHSFNLMAAEIVDRERKITHLALHDRETDLPNRWALLQAVDAGIARPDRGRTTVLVLGIDRFQMMRGAIGARLVGELVRELAARLSQRRPDLFIARLSAGELAAVLPTADLAEAQAFAERLLDELEGALDLGGTTVDIGLTVGLAVHGLHGAESAVLLERASIALDQARALRRKVSAFDAAAYGDPASNLSLMSEMLKAMACGDLTLAHQPQLDLRSGAIVGVEALSRWRHPVRGFVSPDLFVGMAEETGHIRALTEWSLERALADQAAFRAAGHDIRVAVNLSGRLVGDRDFARAALDRIHRAGGLISFEITETAVIDGPDAALEMVQMYGENGVPIAIDDFGSGLSSLAYLKQIAAHELKIDKAFVLALDQSRRDALLVKSTIDLAHGLGMKVVAEGVETAQSLALLAAMGCDIGQGYHIGRPMAPEKLIAFLDAFEAPTPQIEQGRLAGLG
jgi:diguanylate cyclase (GGDEF)-like protein